MAIATDEEVDKEVQAPDEEVVQMPMASQVPVSAPGVAPVAPPAARGNGASYDPEEVRQNMALRQMLRGMVDAPIDEAEKAVTTAMKFQAIRGYQRDLANGVQASDAMAKWAPMMFSQPKAGTLGQAAAMVRATRPDVDKSAMYGAPEFFDVPGIPGAKGVYRKGSPGLHIVSPIKPPSTSGLDATRLRVMAELPKMIASLQDMDPGSPEYAAATNSIAQTKQYLNRTAGAVEPSDTGTKASKSGATHRFNPKTGMIEKIKD